MHAFARGPWPFDPESAKESAQFHLNVERIRVPEVVFQPSIAGVDQAGLTEIAEDILMQRLVNDISAASAANNTSVAARVSKDIFLTGGYSMFQGFEERWMRGRARLSGRARRRAGTHSSQRLSGQRRVVTTSRSTTWAMSTHRTLRSVVSPWGFLVEV